MSEVSRALHVSPSPVTRRALVVAYCFPPNGAIGSFRTLRLVKQLVAEGWHTSVLTGAADSYPEGTLVDHQLLRQVPAETRVVPAAALRGLAALTRAVRRIGFRRRASAPTQNPGLPSPAAPATPRLGIQAIIEHLCGIPDSDAGWLLPAVVRGLIATWRQPPDVIFSSAPPWTGHLVAYLLASVLRRPWVADFRDPWTRGRWRNNRPPFVKRTLRVLERLTVAKADALTFTTRTVRDDFVGFYGPHLASKCHVISNGCDLDEFVNLVPQPTGERFTLAHVGSLYGGRNPIPLFKAIASALRTGALDPRHFTLLLVGPVTLKGLDAPALCRELGLGDVVEFVPSMSRRESLATMVSASALLLVQPDHPLAIPAKTYEYLAASKPILALAGEGETATLVRASGRGVVVPPDDEAAIQRALLELVGGRYSDAPPAPAALFDGRMRAIETVAILRDLCEPAFTNDHAAQRCPEHALRAIRTDVAREGSACQK
jgi:glycosyltransferase involved in cell wall biosynthesis